MTAPAAVWTEERRADAAALGGAAASRGLRLHLVGGAVRDLALARSFEDVDVAVEGDPACLAGFFDGLRAAGFTVEAVHPRFGTATATSGGGTRIDLAAARTETYARPGALPTVRLGASIADDLARRDFTVHAMARRIAEDGGLGEILDPFGGLGDLEVKRLRLLHAGSLRDDPTRALRGIRYAARLGFTLDASFGTSLALAREAGAFGRVSGDRLRRGLEDVLYGPEAEAAGKLLSSIGLLDDLVPGWSGQGVPSSWAGDEDPWKRLLAPLPTPFRRTVATRLSFSRKLCRMAGVPLR